MIISYKYKFIFITVPRTAAISVHQAMVPYLGEKDLEQYDLLGQRILAFRQSEAFQDRSMMGRELRGMLDQETWSSFFKFSIVRNPYDRFVSLCASWHNENEDFKKNPTPYLYHVLLNKRIYRQALFRAQTDYLTDQNEVLLTDYVGKYEKLQESFDHIGNITGVPTSQLCRTNPSALSDYSSYYNEEIKDLVNEFYNKDFELFHYTI